MIQAPNLADVWSLENVWAIIKERVKDPLSTKELRKVIRKEWR